MANPVTPAKATRKMTARRPAGRIRGWDNRMAFFTLIPSLILLGVFVYGFIAWSGYVSLTNWNSFIPNLTWAGLRNYTAIFSSFRFQSDLRNLVIFTVLFIAGDLVVGMILALLVDQKIRAEGLFRSIFIYPMAISMVVTGVIWSWILNPTTGINLFFHALGFKHVPAWFLSTRFAPSIHLGQIDIGIPVALLAVVIAAVWQMSGFAMAVYLGGLRSVPEELKEASRIDGAGPWRMFWSVVLPQLKGTTATIVVIQAAASLKVFGLIYAMTGSGQDFSTDMPNLNMFQTTFQGDAFAQGAAIAIVLLLLMAAFTVPYVLSMLRGER